MKLKTFLLCGLLALFVQAAAQAPVAPHLQFQSVTQPDGTTLRVKTHVDHRSDYIFYTTADNLALVRTADGRFCYAKPDGERLASTGVLAHEPDARSAAEDKVADNALSMAEAFELLAPRAQKVNQAGRPRVNRISSISDDGFGNYGETGGGAVNSIGEYTIPVVLVSFDDIAFQAANSVAALTDYYNKEGYSLNGHAGSVRDYFISQSRGLFKPTFEIAAEVTLSREHGYYGGDRESARDTLLWAFMTEVFNKVKEKGVNMNKYIDKRANNGIPLVAIIYAGTGQASSGKTDDIWPCEMDLGSYYSASTGGWPVNSVFFGNELSGSKLMGIGTFCHEFGHALGLPDFYDTEGQRHTTMGSWSVMDVGSYYGNSAKPVGYTAHERSFLGWLDVPVLKENHMITLYPYSSSKSPNAVAVFNDADLTECYILENRTPDTWYQEDMGSGILVTHLHYSKEAWRTNKVNTDATHLRFSVVPADNSLSYDASDLYGNSSNRLLNDKSTPATKTFSGDGGLHKPIYKLYKQKDGTMTFAFGQANPPAYYVGDTVDVKENGLTVVVRENKELTVVAQGYGGYVGDVVVPSDTVDFDHQRFTYTGVSSDAFTDCPDLTSVVVGNKVRSIGYGAFARSASLGSISVADDNAYYESLDGALYAKQVGLLPAGETKTVSFNFGANPWGLPVSASIADMTTGLVTSPIISDGVTLELSSDSIAPYIYNTASGSARLRPGETGLMRFTAGGNRITKVVFNVNTMRIESNQGAISAKTWTGNESLLSFTVTARVAITSIDVTIEGPETAERTLIAAPLDASEYAVRPDVTIIALSALEGAKLTSLELPASLQLLEPNALSIPALASLTCAAVEPPACPNGDPFTAVPDDCVLHIPAGTRAAYAAAPYWSRFIHVEEDAATGIDDVPMAGGQWPVAYDLLGRRVSRTDKGIYIIDGRKVIR